MTTRTIAIFVLAVLTIALGVAAVVIGFDLVNNGGGGTTTSSSSSIISSSSSTSSDVSVAFDTQAACQEALNATNSCQQRGGQNTGYVCNCVAVAEGFVFQCNSIDTNRCPGGSGSENQGCLPGFTWNGSECVRDQTNTTSTSTQFTTTYFCAAPSRSGSDPMFANVAANGCQSSNRVSANGASLNNCVFDGSRVNNCGVIQCDTTAGQFRSQTYLSGCTGSPTNSSSSSQQSSQQSSSQSSQSSSQQSSSSSTSSAESEETDVSVIKSSSMNSCPAEGDAVVSYTVTVFNTGTTAASLNQVTDTLESGVTASQISNISNGGTASGNVITWAGPINVPAGGQVQFTYTVSFTLAQREAVGAEVENTVVVQYDSNTRSFTLITNLNCLPATGLFDEESRPLLLGIIMIILGILVNRIYPWVFKKNY